MMKKLTPVTKEEKEVLLASVPKYRALGPYHLESFDQYRDLTDNHMPVSEILETHNCILHQKSFGTTAIAENNYYTGVRKRNHISGSWINGPIYDKEGNDITEMVREAEKVLL